MIALTCTLLLTVKSCRQEGDSGQRIADPEPSGDLVEPSLSPSYEEVWMMRGWQGHMGVVLGLKEGTFHYWFISDAGPSSEWAKGTYSRSDEKLTLRISHDSSIGDPPSPRQNAVLGRKSVETDRLYSDTWRVIREDGKMFLVSADDLANDRDSGRWLRSVDPSVFAKYFPDGGPFILHMNPQLEGEASSSNGG